MTPLLVALGAGLGTALRFTASRTVDREAFPLGTWLVNLVGSFVLGALAGAGVAGDALALLGVGFCGGLTTYSSFAVQTHERGPRHGTAYAALTLGLALAACSLGFLLTS